MAFAFFLVVFFAVGSGNILLTLVAFGLVPVFFMLVWKPGEYPVLLLVLGIHWLQVVTKVFHANVIGAPVEILAVSRGILPAIWYSMAGLLVLAIGMKIGSGRKATAISLGGLDAYSLRQLWFAYLLSMVGGLLLKTVVLMVPQFTQILLPLTNIRWLFFLLLLSCVLRRRAGYQLIFIVVAFEIIIGFTGYFSGFKTVFYFMFIAYFALRPIITKREILWGSALVILLFSLSIFWTSIKQDYRYYLNFGSGQQVVQRSIPERLSWLSGALFEIEFSSMGEGVEDLATRISYTDFFAATIMWVPSREKHQGGALWGAAIKHITMPRLLFPDKPQLFSDSELTMQYTGLRLGSDKQGTSISIGYMGESYVDFGFPGMLMPIFLVGIMYGFIYRYFMARESGSSIASAFAVVCLAGFVNFEIHTVKLLGGMIMTFLVYALVLKFISPMVLPLLRRRVPAPD